MEIVVASSNLFRRELSSFILSEAGYVVHEVNDSAALLQCLATTRPALLLIDDSLGGADAVNLAQSLRQRETAIPIIVLTSSSAVLNSVAIAADDGDAHLDWPYQAEELLVHVQQLARSRSNSSPLSSISSA